MKGQLSSYLYWLAWGWYEFYTSCLRPGGFVYAEKTGPMLKIYKVAKVKHFQNGNGNFVPFMEIMVGQRPLGLN